MCKRREEEEYKDIVQSALQFEEQVYTASCICAEMVCEISVSMTDFLWHSLRAQRLNHVRGGACVLFKQFRSVCSQKHTLIACHVRQLREKQNAGTKRPSSHYSSRRHADGS